MKKINLILPKTGVQLDLQAGESIYFLAGPIRGANDWQAKAIAMLADKDPLCYIACPCRYTDAHTLYQHALPPTYAASSQVPVLEFPNQTMWERYYLEQAAQHGAIIFWLPCEDKENPRKKEDGPYARDTYGELGRWCIKSALGHQKVNLVVGAEDDFPGLSVIQKNFDADHGKQFPIYNSLDETVERAVEIAKKKSPQLSGDMRAKAIEQMK